MDSFSVLPDALLIKILSFVPTKVAVSTSVLSKRWEYFWMWLPKLEYDCIGSSSSECERLQCFLNRNMPLHKAPVLESLHLDLSLDFKFKPANIKLWIEVAISHYLRELEVFYYSYAAKLDILPRNLYTCKSLAVLKIEGYILLDVPQMVFLPSLKTLHLNGTRYFSEDSLPRLLSNCPNIEDLLVDIYDAEIIGDVPVVGHLTIVSSSLQRLSVYIPYYCDIGGIVIKTPSLKYFKLVDHYTSNHNWLIENMPNLIEAHLDVELLNIQSFIGSLTFVKHLAICLGAMYGEGFVFNQLRHLQICRGSQHWSDLLVRLLNDSPNLQVLDIFEMNALFINEFFYWKQPSTIPECVSSTLQTFKWEGYTGTPKERDFVVYILKNARHLKTTTIKYVESKVPKHKMIKELELTSRASTTCQLVFVSLLDQ